MKWLHCSIIHSLNSVFTKYQKIGIISDRWKKTDENTPERSRSHFACSIALSSPDRGLRLSRDGSRYGREGVLWDDFAFLGEGNYSNVRKIWTTRIHAHETCPSVALNNEELNKVWQIKTKEKNISENIPFDLYCTTWRVLLGAVQFICFFVICLLVWKCYKRKPFRKACSKICYVSDPVSARRWDFRPDNQLSGQSRIANKSRFVLWLI